GNIRPADHLFHGVANLLNLNKLLSGKWNQNEMLEYLVRDTRRYAKRQMTWFRKNQELNRFARNDYERIAAQAAERPGLQKHE
ncbi:MAG: hypothetical protein D3914_10895, partial [Candidatus Electrothrix sp. LOE2]|nr:hypothetical protein [Candidatus Electrothrix sp. LOE2]